MEDPWELAAVIRMLTDISVHPREGGDPVVKITGDGILLGSRLRGNEWGVGAWKTHGNLPL